MDEHIYVDLPTCTPNSDCKTDPHVTEGYTGQQEPKSVKGQSLPYTPIETAEFKTNEHPLYFTLAREDEPGKSQWHKTNPVNDDNQPRTLAKATEYTDTVDYKKPIYLDIEPSVKETLCTHLSTIRDKWWLFLLIGVCVGGILIGLIVFAALKSKDTSQQGSMFMFELQSRESC